MNSIVLAGISIFYLIVLFVIASYTESSKHKFLQRDGIKSTIYALSIAVYCTAWTFYGSVGNAAKSGMSFLPVYLGPTLMMPLLWLILRKIIRISKRLSISNIADFLSIRFGQNRMIGIVVAVLFFIGIIPYISLQIKAIDTSFNLLTHTTNSKNFFFNDITFYLVLLIIFFTILFGTRHIDTTEKKQGLISAIAFESVVKLLSFLGIGFYIVYHVYDSPKQLFSEAFAKKELQQLFTLNNNLTYFDWLMLILLSAIAIIMLPRQFQVSVVENNNEQDIKKASWVFPAYLILINLFVLPIAIAGKLLLPSNYDADMYILGIPLLMDNNVLATIIYLGGFAAASGMIIIETIALSIMLGNHIVIPLVIYFNRNRKTADHKLGSRIKLVRRFTIVGTLLLAYVYDKFIASNFPLTSIGFVSFVAVAQFAPGLIGGLFFKWINQKGAMSGILVGFAIWFFTLIIPSFANKAVWAMQLCNEGLFGIELLKPNNFLGMPGNNSISISFFWTMFFNVGVTVLISLLTTSKSNELIQAALFVNIFEQEEAPNQLWRGDTYLKDIISVLSTIIGEKRALTLINGYAERHKINLQEQLTDERIIQFAENILASSVGISSAQVLIKNITHRNEISIEETLKILQENQKVLISNKELKKRQNELTKVTDQLTQANQQLQEIDSLKDEFLYTVTHELRTPLTSIRAMSEILEDNPDLSEEERLQFLNSIVSETERLSHLITQVLNLEKFESGRHRLNNESFDYIQLTKDAIQAVKPIIDQRGIRLQTILPDSQIFVWGDKYLLMQVFNNLLSNAIKFCSPSNGVITLKVAEVPFEVETIIEDNGEGIQDDVKELIFDKFFQAKNQTLKKPVGSGLGLAICKKIIVSHQGKIWVENNRVKGSRFIFTLPIK